MLPLVGSTIVPPGRQESVALSGVDDIAGDAVFGRPARIEVLDFREHRGADAVSDVVQADEGGVAYEIGNAVGVSHDEFLRERPRMKGAAAGGVVEG